MDFDKGKETISQIISAFSYDLSKMRSGKASIDMVESVQVSAYDSKLPISHVATISVPDPKTIIIQPWDKSITKEIEKSIQTANLGFNPVVDGDIVRVSIPSLTQELRDQYVREMRERMEQAKVSVRGVRHKIMEHLESEKEDGVSEDEIKRQKDMVEDEVKKSIEQIEKIGQDKEKELMTV